MTSLSKVKALVVDNGLYPEFASRLARDMASVRYYVAWESAFPRIETASIGKGLDGIEKVNTVFGPWFDEIDLFVFPDIYHGPIQVFLESIGKNVWGSRMAEELETNRQGTKRLLERLGQPVQPWRVVTGIVKLREFLKNSPHKFVKVDRYRGDFETLAVDRYEDVENNLDELEYKLGAYKRTIEFIVEDELPDRIEIGPDGYTVDGKFPDRILLGPEAKGRGYAGVLTPYNELPREVLEFNKAIAPTLKSYGYRGPLSYEIRTGADRVGYMIDFCSRLGSPPNELYQEFYENISEVCWLGSRGVLVHPKTPASARWGVQVTLSASRSEQSWQRVSVDKSVKRFVKLRNVIKQGTDYWTMPQPVGSDNIGSVIGWGTSLRDARAMLETNLKGVRGYRIEPQLEALDEVERALERGRKWGIKAFSS